MKEKVPKWESELWSYLSTGNGIHCPLYYECQLRKNGSWCSDDLSELIIQIINSDEFNPSDYAFLVPGEEGLIFQRVEALAVKCLDEGNISAPPVPEEMVPLFDQQHRIEVHSLPLTVCHGAVWRTMGGWLIQLKQDDPPDRKRLTLFHEAFHILAHCKASPIFKKIELNQGSFNEQLADYFACCILMPKKWLVEKWTETKDLDRMAEIFNAPRSVMWLRLIESGLL